MSKPPTKSTILDDGLRYKAKAGGSPFRIDTFHGTATMSCFLCGKHRPRTLLGTKKFIGKSQTVCSPSCKELDAIIKANGA